MIQKKVISDKESSQFILTNLKSQDLEPVVFIVGAEEDVRPISGAVNESKGKSC